MTDQTDHAEPLEVQPPATIVVTPARGEDVLMDRPEDPRADTSVRVLRRVEDGMDRIQTQLTWQNIILAFMALTIAWLMVYVVFIPHS